MGHLASARPASRAGAGRRVLISSATGWARTDLSYSLLRPPRTRAGARPRPRPERAESRLLAGRGDDRLAGSAGSRWRAAASDSRRGRPGRAPPGGVRENLHHRRLPATRRPGRRDGHPARTCPPTPWSQTVQATSRSGRTASSVPAHPRSSHRRAARWATGCPRRSPGSSCTPSGCRRVAGDGDFLMTGQELATAVQQGAAILVLVVNNGMYGTIRMHQERRFPGAGLRHGSRQSRFRGAGAIVRRSWRASSTDRRVRRRRSSAARAAGCRR